MLPTIWANFLDYNRWSSKLFKENIIEGTRTFLVLIGGGKKPPYTKNEVLGGRHSSATSLELELYARFPLEKYFNGISISIILPTKIPSPSNHWCNWL